MAGRWPEPCSRGRIGRERRAEEDDTAAPSIASVTSPEEEPAPQRAEERHEIGHGDRVARPGVGDEAKVAVGDAGARDRSVARRPRRQVTARRTATTTGPARERTTAAPAWLPAAIASGGTPTRRWRV